MPPLQSPASARRSTGDAAQNRPAPRPLPSHRLSHRCKHRCLHHCPITPHQTARRKAACAGGVRLDGFCLVSSDSDFTRLASRLREQGADVYGFGEQKTPESFRQACRKFIYTENLLPEAQVSTAEEGPSSKALQPPSSAIPILNKAIMQMETEDGWVGLGTVGQRLANIASDFDPRTYGYRKLSDLVRKTGAFDIDQPEGRAMRIRVKPKPTSKTRAKATAVQ
jgi:OST-HTH/LOTUS domain/NYN domain